MAKESLPGLAMFLFGLGKNDSQDHSSALNAHDSNYNGFVRGFISILFFFSAVALSDCGFSWG